VIGIIDSRPKRSLSDAILSAIGSLTVLYFAGLLFRRYVPPEVLQSFLEFLKQVPLVLLVVIWIVLIVVLFVIVFRMPREWMG
jgi:hypothetical protein